MRADHVPFSPIRLVTIHAGFIAMQQCCSAPARRAGYPLVFHRVDRLLEQKDEWATQRAKYMTLETIAPLSDTPFVSLPELAA